MTAPSHRSKETLDLMRRFKTSAARRRKRRIWLACGGAAVFLALVATAIALSVTQSSGRQDAGATTSLAALETSTTSSLSTTTSAGEAQLPVAGPDILTTLAPPTTIESPAAPGDMSGYVVVIDAGHQAKADYDLEPVGPGSSQMKAKVSSGTRSVNTGTPESQLVLAVSLKLRDSLQAQGIQVVMTRTSEQVTISNVERAQMANAAGADLFVRIHADGATDKSIHGILMLYPASISGWTDDIAAESKRAAQLALDELVAATGTRSRGMSARRDLTGFNWSDVPVILPEIGLMTNPAEDALLATPEYQDKLVLGLTNAILKYLGE